MKTTSTMKNKIVLLIILVLLASNIALLYFYFNKSNTPRGRGRMMEKFQKEVGLTDAQAKEFETFRKAQKETLVPGFDSMQLLKKEYMEAIFNGSNIDSLKAKYATRIGASMLTMDKKMIDHLMEARKICTPDQFPAYDSIIKKMMLRGPERRTREKN